MVYQYKGIDSLTGKEVKGKLSVTTKTEAMAELKRKGYISLKSKSGKKPF